MTNGTGDDLPTQGMAIVEFSDYQCPYCAKHARETLPELRKQFVDTGKAQYVFMNLPLEAIHSRAFDAAKAGACARRQGRFWELHDWMFENQPKLSEGKFVDEAPDLGINKDGFNRCFEDIDGEIRAEMREASRLGIQSTPTFFLGEIGPGNVFKVRRRINGAAPFDMFRAELEGLSMPTAAGIWQRLAGSWK